MSDNNYIFTFKRRETKYLLDERGAEVFLSRVGEYLVPDKYGRSTVGSLYADTPDHRIIRGSIDAVNFKEKIRLRTYGITECDGLSFIEIKRKYDGIVYKRRIAVKLCDGMGYMYGKCSLPPSRIADEIGWFMKVYREPKPSAAIFCEREAFTVPSLPDLRITLDRNIRARTERLSLETAVYGSDGTALVGGDTVLMEIKASDSYPLWLTSVLDGMRLFPVSFSKYGTAYKNLICKYEKGT